MIAENRTCISNCRIPNCKVCSSYITCATCSLGFIAVSSYHCSPVCSVSDCLLCSDNSSCVACSDGYRLYSNACQLKCSVDNCDHCQNINSCGTCDSGYTRMVDNLGKGVCKMACHIGQYNNSGTCAACSLAGCEACSSGSACLTCRPTYYLTAPSCTLCSATFTNCLVCIASSCLQCQQGFVKNSHESCVPLGNCSNGCIKCAGGVFSACSPSFYLNSNKTCTPKCTTGIYTPSGCACLPGLRLLDGVCITCRGGNCLKCDQVACLKCKSGYYPLLDTCVACISNCESCSSAAICDKCELGYTYADNSCKFDYLNPFSTSQCPLGCAFCYFIGNNPYCTKPNDGFVFGTNSVIVHCDLARHEHRIMQAFVLAATQVF